MIPLVRTSRGKDGSGCKTSSSATFPVDSTGKVLSVSSTYASLNLGGAFTASVSDGADADDLALTGTYNFNTDAFSLNADEVDLAIPGFITAEAEGVSINYDPNAAPGQELVGIENLSVMIFDKAVS